MVSCYRSMKSKILAYLLGVALLAGCPATDKKPIKARGKQPGADASLPGRPAVDDVAFQGFVGRLREAVTNHDLPAMASMMTDDFGYRWDAAPEGETPFSYWDENNLWPRLSALLASRWTPHDGFMVVPVQWAEDENYRGYRAGISMVEGSWRFAYFVPAAPQQ